MFSAFLKHLRNVLEGDWGGVRVAELHKEHGVHYHALINRRLSVDVVRRVARCHGIGRIFVEVADNNGAAYLSKYLSKQRAGPLCRSGRRARRWASFGPIRKTRVCDVVNDSPMWVYRRANNLPFLGYRWEGFLNSAWIMGEEVFRAVWFAAKTGREGDVLGLVHGFLKVENHVLIRDELRRLIRGPFCHGPF